MPATTRTARACALALAGVGLTASTLTAPLLLAPAASAATGDRTVSTTENSAKNSTKDSTRDSAKDRRDRQRERARRAAQRVDTRVLGARDTALRQRGDAYAYGAAGPNSFDCSGLVYYSFRRAGFPVPRTSAAQAAFTRRVAKTDMRAGDLMFFHDAGGVYHAAIFLRWSHGHALMLHAPSPGQRVQVAVPWTSQWFGGTLRRR